MSIWQFSANFLSGCNGKYRLRLFNAQNSIKNVLLAILSALCIYIKIHVRVFLPNKCLPIDSIICKVYLYLYLYLYQKNITNIF